MSRDPSRATLGFAWGDYDRAAHLREQPEHLASMAVDRKARFLLQCGDVPVIRKVPGGLDPFFPREALPATALDGESIFLGFQDGAPRFGLLVPEEAAGHLTEEDGHALIDLRSIAVQALFDGSTMGALATHKALRHWHASHRFCARCGAESAMSKAGWQRSCARCGTEHFPRTDPVVIMLAVSGDRCLMGRSGRFLPNMYSCLAGFMEPGETIEAAVRREIFEESGIRTGDVRVLFSQPWPFPASLMIGAIAQATSDEITIDPSEIEDARWFSREETVAILAGDHPGGVIAPTAMSAAHHVVLAWLGGEVTA